MIFTALLATTIVWAFPAKHKRNNNLVCNNDGRPQACSDITTICSNITSTDGTTIKQQTLGKSGESLIIGQSLANLGDFTIKDARSNCQVMFDGCCPTNTTVIFGKITLSLGSHAQIQIIQQDDLHWYLVYVSYLSSVRWYSHYLQTHSTTPRALAYQIEVYLWLFTWFGWNCIFGY